MRILWTLIGILVLVTVGVTLMGGEEEPLSRQAADSPAAPAAQPQRPRRTPVEPPAADPTPAKGSIETPAVEPTPSTDNEVVENDATPAISTPAAVVDSTPVETPAASVPAIAKDATGGGDPIDSNTTVDTTSDPALDTIPAQPQDTTEGLDTASDEGLDTASDEGLDTASDEAEALVNDLIASSDERRPADPSTAAPDTPAATEPADPAPGDDTVVNTPDGEPAEVATAGGSSDPTDPASAGSEAKTETDTDAAAEAKIVKRDDGSMLIDDKYVVRGAGTQDDPYRITWELLVSASQTYRPRLGETEIPDRVNMLHDSWVSITGYLAFPLASQQVTEALVMLNQWDGCCIGLPPSPYDAVEAQLSTAFTPRRGHMLQYGTILGKLKVDPYIVNDWLVGLYLMEEATIKAE